ncbi:acetyl-CoA synthetase-like protein [Dichomitus squalens]|uniref:Acetyl-CoA synthetase-like protein n=1 Tax=Dichomitus squalens TaxID=114155 RepID=A0A4Q9MY81_9APHY|nr:acetyl-CoA synthetase-like protein [Dichomitus squalens]
MTAVPAFRSPRELVISGELSMPELYEWHARENPDYPLYRFHDGNEVNTLTYAQVIKAIRRAARYVQARIATPQIVAVIANIDTITYSIIQLGIMRAGYTMFLISPRNVPAAVADMLRKTECRHLLLSSDALVQDLAKKALAELNGVTLHDVPTFEQLFPADASVDGLSTEDLPATLDINGLCMILHSSGSTNHPKPVRWTHKKMMSWSSSPWYGEVDLSQVSLSIHGTPMFHAIGVMMYCLAANNGMLLGVFPPTSPPTFPTPENVFDGIVKTSSEYIMTAPAMIEMWAREPAKVEHMKTMKGLIFGGAPLDQGVGDMLASQGINLYSLYGSTEIGAIAKFFTANPGMDWAYFQLNPMHDQRLVDAGEGRYELIVISDPEIPLPIVNTKFDGKDAYATNDILERHPTRPNFYRYYGRLDDQIILSNGEKTNPGPLESIISEDPHVQGCIIFGQGKFQNGLLIEPTPEYRFDPQDLGKLVDFRNKIWKSIERANEFAPQHSRLFKEMIIVTSPGKPFSYNIKGYPRRTWILKDYQEEIAALYKVVEESAQSDVGAPAAWNNDSTRTFLRTVVERVLKKSIPDDADFFRHGCDSLQATWIRNTLLRAVRETSPTSAKLLPMSIVYQAPTISALTEAVLHILHNKGVAPTATTAHDLVLIAEKYSSNLPPRPAQLRARQSDKDVVLITGTTGGFGCDVLEHLLRDERVERVYAFNRPGSQAMERQLTRFKERALDESLLTTPKFRMIEAALDVPGFGIEPQLLDEIRDSVTHILHNAWTVNFNLALSSFEPDLKAVRNLVELSLSSPHSSPPRIQFTSSIGVFASCNIPPPIPEVSLDPSSPLGSGYGESKWIAEQVLYNVAQRAGVPIVVVRLGQISGDKTGHWNEREWFPALVKSASLTSHLPNVEGEASFFLSYPAARAFVEMRSSPEPILHLVHPRPIPWRSLITPIAQELQATLVPYVEWLAALEAAAERNAEAAREHPALRLLDFFRSSASANTKTPLGLYQLDTKKAVGASETLASMPELGEADIKRWIAAWRASGFLPASA